MAILGAFATKCTHKSIRHIDFINFIYVICMMEKYKAKGVYMSDTHLRSVVKGISWRVLGTLDTMFLAFLVTGVFASSVKIGFTEVFTKIALFYVHERIWNVIPFGRIHGVGPTHLRSLVKGVSWRVLGTIDTIVISYFITGQWVMALKIGSFEVITKIILFYLHERVWGKVSWGRIIQKSEPAPVATAAPQAVVPQQQEVLEEEVVR